MCGNPENRQVSTNRPQVVTSLASHVVIDVAVGGEHTLALTSNHLVFSWGSNTDGQVSCETFKQMKKIIVFVVLCRSV